MLLFPLAIVSAAENASVVVQGEWTLLGPVTGLTTGLMAELALGQDVPNPDVMTTLGLGPDQQAQVLRAREVLAGAEDDPQVAQLRTELETLRDATVSITGSSMVLRFGGEETELLYSIIRDSSSELQVMTVDQGGSELITFTMLTPDLLLMLEADQQVPLLLARRPAGGGT